MSVVLVAALAVQFWLRRYVPAVYSLAVVLISIVGTLITDNFGVSLVITTIVFSVVLASTFATWWSNEQTLSIHTIYTTRRALHSTRTSRGLASARAGTSLAGGTAPADVVP
jgi:uncharacterized membrane-anchored protein